MPSPLSARLTAVVVTWNAADEIGGCLTSLPPDVRVVVVDNASQDGSADAAAAARPDATVVRTGRNLGFAAGVAAGLARVEDADAVLLLNPDARLEPGALDTLTALLHRQPRAGLVSALVVDRAGVPERFAGGRALSLSSLAVHELGLARLLPSRSTYRPGPQAAAEQRDWVAATAVLARRAAIDAVGGPDPSFFLYAEDRDWCRRLRSAGWEVWVEPAARVVHRRSASVNAAGSWVDVHRIGALDAYWQQLHGGRRLVPFRLLRLTGTVLRAAALSVLAPARGPEARARAAQRRRDALLHARLLLTGRLPGARA
jgi:N-acetylglucosaminyl-diphospho-decaprenol L-rhamnosyltransferase